MIIISIVICRWSKQILSRQMIHIEFKEHSDTIGHGLRKLCGNINLLENL